MKKIPHRYPFLLVDKVIDYKEAEWIKAIKNVTMNELFFQGHFPEEPIMPGVLMIEALAQTGGILALMEESEKEKLAFFMTINNAKFRKPVVPGDQLHLFVSIVKVVRGKIVQTHGEASVEGKVVCEADLMFSIFDKQ
ncbi:MAG: 3-hydroxyacyl-ACP dehydratase FabZ [Candidatus Omnitrophica bacterium]|nr:3-hydroxyacyl-ACP dehydratase FabZ [Candidatus Omnitrophota bacterium]MBU1894205.1 3-hydroxyacyl-ACP dehydratase FabZ [Candidatus Omnitrophota bacterium]